MDINSMTPASGRTVEENGAVTNIADMLAEALGVPPIANITANIEAYAPRTGRIISESGQVYNMVDFLRAILAGGGGGGSGGITLHNLLDNLGFAQSGHTGFASAEALTEAILAEATARHEEITTAVNTEAYNRLQGDQALNAALIETNRVVGTIHTSKSDVPLSTMINGYTNVYFTDLANQTAENFSPGQSFVRDEAGTLAVVVEVRANVGVTVRTITTAGSGSAPPILDMAAETDLNTLTTAATYIIQSSDFNTLINRPPLISQPFGVLVVSGGVTDGGSVIVQTYIAHSASREEFNVLWQRVGSVDGQFGEWRAQGFVNTELPGGTDLNDITLPGSYNYSTTGPASDFNFPEGWNGQGTLLVVGGFRDGGAFRLVSQMIVSTANSNKHGVSWTRTFNGSAWTPWVQAGFAAISTLGFNLDAFTSEGNYVYSSATGDGGPAMLSGQGSLTVSGGQWLGGSRLITQTITAGNNSNNPGLTWTRTWNNSSWTPWRLLAFGDAVAVQTGQTVDDTWVEIPVDLNAPPFLQGGTYIITGSNASTLNMPIPHGQGVVRIVVDVAPISEWGSQNLWGTQRFMVVSGNPAFENREWVRHLRPDGNHYPWHEVATTDMLNDLVNASSIAAAWEAWQLSDPANNTLSLEDWLTQIMFPQTYARLNGDNTFTGNNTWSGNETHNGNVNVNGNLTVGGNDVALRTDGQVLRLRITGLNQSISSTPWAIFQGRTLADIVVAEQTNIDYSQWSIDPATGALTFPNIDAYVKYDIDIRPTGTSNVSGNNSAAVICRMLRQVTQTVATSGRVTVTGALPSLNMDSIFIPTFTMNAQDAYIQGGVVPQLLSGATGTITQLDIVIFINRH